MVVRRSRARPSGRGFGLARTRVLVSRTILTVASCEKGEERQALHQAQVPSARVWSPAGPANPWHQYALQAALRRGHAGALEHEQRSRKDSAREPYGQLSPASQRRGSLVRKIYSQVTHEASPWASLFSVKHIALAVTKFRTPPPGVVR